jgi:phosphoribosylformylglycinamidine cyclo-ligase
MKYLPSPMKVVKNNLFEPPKIFEIIQEASKSSYREMYQVFNMGHRLEIFTAEANAGNIISIAEKFGIAAQVIGRVEEAIASELVLQGDFGEIRF